LHSNDGIKEIIRQRVDLVGLISESVSLQRSGAEMKGLCPFHEEKTPSFNVNPDKGVFLCRGCGAGGDIFQFVQLRERVDFREALEILADRAGIDPGELQNGGRGRAQGPSRADLTKVLSWAAGFFAEQLADDKKGGAAREYLAGRKISPEMVKKFQIGLSVDDPNQIQQAGRMAGYSLDRLRQSDLVRSSDHGGYYDTFRHRLMFPIRDSMRRVIAFGGRTLGDHQAKYLNSAETALFSKSKCLYGIDVSRSEIERTGIGIVVEGYTDCVACHQHGFTNVVATLGTAMTPEHLSMLRRYGDEVILLFDSDEAGLAAAERAVGPALRSQLRVRLASVPSGKDPGEFLQTHGSEELRELLNSASEALVFQWSRTRARFAGTDSGIERRKAVEEYLGLIASLSHYGAIDVIQRGEIANQVSTLLAMPVDEVHRQLSSSQRRVASQARGRSNSADSQPGHGDQSVPMSRTGLSRTGMSRTGLSGGDRRSGEQAALGRMIEVLLCEPGLFALLDESGLSRRALLGRVVDEDLVEIAAVLLAMADEIGEFGIGELVSRFEEPRLAGLIMTMFERGRSRGNYEETLRNSLDKLAECETKQESAALVASLTRPRSGSKLDETAVGDLVAEENECGSPVVGDSRDKVSEDEEADLERLAAVHRVLLKNRGFSSPRADRVYRPSKMEVPGL
jgi:DNA primase